MAVRNSHAAVEVKSYNWFQKNVLASEEPPNIAESSHKAPTEKAHWIRVDVSGHSQVICSPLTDDDQKAHRGLAEDWEMTQRGLVCTSHRLVPSTSSSFSCRLLGEAACAKSAADTMVFSRFPVLREFEF